MKFSLSRDSDRRARSKLRAYDGQYFELDALFRRLERFEARRGGERTSAVTSLARRRDAELLEQGADFEAAWAHEVATLIEMKRLKSPETEAFAKSARAATALIVARIERTSATTLDGLKVKARAILWRRNGEPLETVDPDDRTGEAAPVATPASSAP
jgi:hypothetical protein